MIVLGIESTAHTFGVGIASDKPPFILSNARKTYIPKEGGIHPREAARHHAAVASQVLAEALRHASLSSIEEVDAIAVALGPGLGPCLRVGATVARALAAYYDKPLVPVNHCVAHIEIGRLATGGKDPLVVYVSGGNTMIVAYSKERYRVFGETLDIALGNMLDTFAREAGLAPPYVVEGLHQVDRVGNKGKNLVELPYVVKGLDVSFSGLLTAALRKYREGVPIEDVCLSLREYAYDMIVEVAERALAHTRKSELLLTGGVAASPILQKKLKEMCHGRGVEFKVVPPDLAGDNGAMIAWTGLLAYKHGITVEPENAVVRQRWRVDEVSVPWRA